MTKKAYFWVLTLAFLCIPALPTLKAEPITIIGIFPRTGGASAIYRHTVRAAELARDEINRTGGLFNNRPLSVEIIDSQSTPLGTQAAGRAAVQMGAVGVIGEFWSTQSLALAHIMQEAGRPMITPESSSPEVTRVGNYIFRACFNDLLQGQALAEFARHELRMNTAVILINHNQRYSLTLAESFGAYFIHMGGRVIWEASYSDQAVDFSDILAIVARKAPDLVFVPGYSRDSALILKQAVAFGIKAVFIGGDGWGPELADMSGADALNNAYRATHWHPDLDTLENRRYLELYQKNFGIERMDKATPLTYDAIMLMADAIRRAGSDEPGKIRDALAATKKFRGVTGPIVFDANGDPVNKPLVILKFQNGAWQPVKMVNE